MDALIPKSLEGHAKRFQHLVTARQHQDNRWQEIAELFYPERAAFTQTWASGANRHRELYTTVMVEARQRLANTIDALLKPQEQFWFGLSVKGVQPRELSEDVKRWLKHSAGVVRGLMYDPAARFVSQTHAADNELVAFGNTCILVLKNEQLTGVQYRTFPLEDVFFESGASGRRRAVYLRTRLKAWEMQLYFGLDPTLLPAGKQSSVGGVQPNDPTYEVVQYIGPSLGGPSPYESLTWVGNGLDARLLRRGAHMLDPVITPSVFPTPGEPYALGFAGLALADAQTLNTAMRDMIDAMNFAVRPAWWTIGDAATRGIKNHPNGLTIADPNIAQRFGGRPFGPIENGSDINAGLAFVQWLEQRIRAVFLEGAFALPENDRMTATEIMARQNQLRRIAGPVLNQFEPTYLAPLVEITTTYAFELGLMRPAPPELAGRQLEVQFDSPLVRTRRQMDLTGAARALELNLPVLQLRPDGSDIIDTEALIRASFDAYVAGESFTHTEQYVAAIRQQRQQQQAVATALAAAQQGAAAFGDAAGGIAALRQSPA